MHKSILKNTQYLKYKIWNNKKACKLLIKQKIKLNKPLTLLKRIFKLTINLIKECIKIEYIYIYFNV